MARLPSRDSYQSRLDDMRRAEFGSPLEIVLRFAVIAVAAIVLLLFIDRQIALAWARPTWSSKAGWPSSCFG